MQKHENGLKPFSSQNECNHSMHISFFFELRTRALVSCVPAHRPSLQISAMPQRCEQIPVIGLHHTGNPFADCGGG
jgi:hypothetical protein